MAAVQLILMFTYDLCRYWISFKTAQLRSFVWCSMLYMWAWSHSCVLKWEMRSHFGINGRHWRCALPWFDAPFNHSRKDTNGGQWWCWGTHTHTHISTHLPGLITLPPYMIEGDTASQRVTLGVFLCCISLCWEIYRSWMRPGLYESGETQ